MLPHILYLGFFIRQAISLPTASQSPPLSITLPLHPSRPETTTIAGVTVPYTPLISSALSYAQAHSTPWLYSHIMRSWLFGTLIIQHGNNTFSNSSAPIDLEVHAVATILHDLGWDQNSSTNAGIVSPDRRFEVDGAIAARNFIVDHKHEDGFGGAEWDRRRLQLVWDAIALHTERSIGYYKEAEVQVVSRGIGLDFEGPGNGELVDKEAYERVVRAFPKDELKNGVNRTIVWLCGTKPTTTWDNWMEKWGDAYIEGYKENKVNRIDTIFSKL